MAPHDDLRRAPARRCPRPHAGRCRPDGASLLLPGGRVPAPRRRAPARRRPGGRPRRFDPAGRRRTARHLLLAGGQCRHSDPSEGTREHGAPRSTCKCSSMVTSEHAAWPSTSPSTPRKQRATTLASMLPSTRSKTWPAVGCPITHIAWSPQRFELGADPEFGRLNLAQHAHRFGYGGHFLTKSRSDSTTFGALRNARVQWREAGRFGGDVPEDHSSEGRWEAIGAGWSDKGESSSPPISNGSGPKRRKKAEFEWYSRSEQPSVQRPNRRRRCGRPLPFHDLVRAGRHELHRQAAQRTLAGPLPRQGRPFPLQDVRPQGGCAELSRRRRPRHPPRRVDRSEAGTHPLRAVGRSVVGDNGEAAPDDSSRVLGHAPAACPPPLRGLAIVGDQLHGRRRVHHASPRSRSLAEVHKGLCLCPLACDEERRAGESAQGQSGCRPQHPNSHAANCTKATS